MNNSTEQDDNKPVHTQTLMASLLPTIDAGIRELTSGRPGQPTKRTPELIEAICQEMRCGLSLLAVCQREDMPAYRTVMRWQASDPTLLAMFDEAREMTAYTLDEVNELIARGYAPLATGEFKRDELLVKINDQRKRHLNRRRFGEKVDHNVTVNEPFYVEAWMLGETVPQMPCEGHTGAIGDSSTQDTPDPI